MGLYPKIAFSVIGALVAMYLVIQLGAFFGVMSAVAAADLDIAAAADFDAAAARPVNQRTWDAQHHATCLFGY